MKKLLSSERNKGLFLIFLIAIIASITYKVSDNLFGYHCKPHEISHDYDPHHCKASEDFGCRG